MAPAALSGVSIFIDKKYITATGTMGYPATAVTRGDVVSITNLTWGSYGTTDPEVQPGWSATSTLTVLGTQPLPAAIPLSATEINGTMGAQYLGMRVTQTDAPDTVTNICPAVLTSM